VIATVSRVIGRFSEPSRRGPPRTVPSWPGGPRCSPARLRPAIGGRGMMRAW